MSHWKKTSFLLEQSALSVLSFLHTIFTERNDVHVIGLDSVSDCYDVSFKEHRLFRLEKVASEHSENTYTFISGNLTNKALIDSVLRSTIQISL